MEVWKTNFDKKTFVTFLRNCRLTKHTKQSFDFSQAA